MDRRAYLATVAAGVAAGLAGCGSGGAATTRDYDVGTRDSAFVPRRYAAAVGETVRWKNTDVRSHTVTAYQARLPAGAAYFASGGFTTERAARDGFYQHLEGALAHGDTFEHRFDVAGAYPYFCVPHERSGMVGTVVVEP